VLGRGTFLPDSDLGFAMGDLTFIDGSRLVWKQRDKSVGLEGTGENKSLRG
jgi:hypothetical protein